MNNKFFSWCLALAACLLLAACGEKQQKAANQAVAKPTLTPPFRYHKEVEVSPGYSFDVLSWGRGSKDVGAFMILQSDSASMKYITTTGDLEGAIVDVYNADMDLDGNPEILIEAKAKDTTVYEKIYAFEFRNNEAQKLDFPKLTSSQKKGYRGSDNFFIREGKLMREFPIYDSNNQTAKLTGAKRLLEYNLRGGSLTAKQLSKDSTDKPQQVASEPVQQERKVVKRTTKKKVTSSKRRRHRR
jgi:CRISPR/Cas system-associated protein endoribonuclease Cas2